MWPFISQLVHLAGLFWQVGMKIRISLVHYLNAAPLGWAFLHGPFSDGFEVIPSSPADCADQLAKGQADIGLIPSIEYQRIPDLRIIPGISISSLDAVRSILLIRSKGTDRIRSVAMDTCSRTSVTLARILLEQKLGIHPEYVSHPPNPPEMLKRCDAAVVIGDPALQVNPEDYDTIDLAQEWVHWQGRPFVCAVWACRSSVPASADLVSTFQKARDWGLKKRLEIAAVFGRSLDLPVPFLDDYLRNNIDYNLGQAHIEGLQAFHRLAAGQGLIPGLRPVQFLESARTA